VLKLRRKIAVEAVTAKNRDILKQDRQRELLDPLEGSRYRTKMPRQAANLTSEVR